MADGEDFNGKVIEEFRANGGKVGGWFEGQTLLLLHHTGAKSGTERVNPLVYRQVGGSYAIFASAAGAPQDPQWFRNLVAHPDVTVEVGTDTINVRARPPHDDPYLRRPARRGSAPRKSLAAHLGPAPLRHTRPDPRSGVNDIL